MSIPNPIAKNLQIQATSEMMRRDGTLLHGLTAAGFAVDSDPDGAGLFMKYFSRGGDYYIDVGVSQLIVDKKIKIKQGHQVKSIKAHNLVLANNSELEADEIVFATRYQNMRETARKIFGNDLAERVHDVWGFDDEGETREMWRRSGHPGFWFFWRKSCPLSLLLEIIGLTDQGYRGWTYELLTGQLRGNSIGKSRTCISRLDGKHKQR